MVRQIKDILVLGAGSAGFLAAIGLRVRIPEVSVTIVRSPEIKIIGVGEGTAIGIPRYLHSFLEVDAAEFYRQVIPIWKLGVRYLWGPRPYFNYVFGRQMDVQDPQLSKPVGYYCDEDMCYTDITSSLMTEKRVFELRPDGSLHIPYKVAYHLENTLLVAFLEDYARKVGVRIIDGTVNTVDQDDHGVTALHFKSGRSISADLYVDCSGFRSVLLAKTLGVPFQDFRTTLFTDRAILGTWVRREGEPIQPYTTVETLNAGWSWRTDHEDRINRGYVYSSSFISDDEAEEEFLAKHPNLEIMGRVGFTSGCYERNWEKNVVAIGNSAGFVEPLEATSLQVICSKCGALVETIRACHRAVTPSMIRAYNRNAAAEWEAIRYDLGAHFKYNTRINTPFWRECQEDIDIGWAQQIEDFYREHGPSRLFRDDWVPPPEVFSYDDFLHMLIGQQVPYRKTFRLSDRERAIWNRRKERLRERARRGVTVEQALRAIRHPSWQWDQEYLRRWN
jgi:tryptophan halogenase